MVARWWLDCGWMVVVRWLVVGWLDGGWMVVLRWWLVGGWIVAGR